jgi:predicted nucleotide-binding protein
MSPRPTVPTPSFGHPALTRPRGETAELLRERIRLGQELQARTIQTADDVGAYGADSTKWMEYNYELLKSMFKSDGIANEYMSYIPRFAILRDDRINLRNSRKKTQMQVTKLSSILERLELYPEPSSDSQRGEILAPVLVASKVFVVHGHDEGALQAVARFLERIDLQAIVLREQPDQGRAVIEKFEACAREVGFAVVLLTPDDVGGAVSVPEQSARARQNVIFALGYFAGALGRGRTCLLCKGDVEIPSDLFGVIYTDFDHPAEGWKIKLRRELRAAGLQFDADRVLA